MKKLIVGLVLTILLTGCVPEPVEVIVVVTATPKPTVIPTATPTPVPVEVELSLKTRLVNPIGFMSTGDLFHIEYGLDGGRSSVNISGLDIYSMKLDRGFNTVWSKVYMVEKGQLVELEITGWADGTCQISFDGEAVSRHSFEGGSMFSPAQGSVMCRALVQ